MKTQQRKQHYFLITESLDIEKLQYLDFLQLKSDAVFTVEFLMDKYNFSSIKIQMSSIKRQISSMPKI
jgi:hypothetical protein